MFETSFHFMCEIMHGCRAPKNSPVNAFYKSSIFQKFSFIRQSYKCIFIINFLILLFSTLYTVIVKKFNIVSVHCATTNFILIQHDYLGQYVSSLFEIKSVNCIDQMINDLTEYRYLFMQAMIHNLIYYIHEFKCPIYYCL